jgi:hypothetical protein
MTRLSCLVISLILCANAAQGAPAHAGGEAAASPASAEIDTLEATPPEDGESGRYTRFYIALPLWVPGYSGQFAIGDVTVDGDGGDGGGGGPDWLGQLFGSTGKLEFFFLGRFRVDVDAWTFLVDFFGGKLRKTVTFRLTDGTLVDAAVRPLMARGIVGHRLRRWPLGSSGKSQLTLRGYGGVRHYNVDLSVTLTENGIPLEQTAKWTDPLVGVQATLDVRDRWRFGAWTDVGGFAVGSRLAWWTEFNAGYRFTDWFNLRLGWTFMYVDYEDTVANQDLRWDMWLSGPSLAIAFSF